MVRSMTAFARQERQGEWGTLALELRSVNHRFLEVSVRLPEELRVLEPRIRERAGQVLGRGKLDCGIRYQAAAAQAEQWQINQELATHLAHLSREVDAILYDPAPVNSLELMKWPGVLEAPPPDREVLQAEALAALDAALEELNRTRTAEGEKLAAALEQRCAGIAELVERVRSRMPEVIQRQRERLLKRLAELELEVEENRLEQEVAILAQKLDVDEELDRLEMHIQEVRRVLAEGGAVGRRLDFLMQELHREANTLGSKSADTETTRAAVDLKVLIEQMREQVQNIE